MIIFYEKFESEKVAIFNSLCSLIMWVDVCKRYCILKNEMSFITIWCFLKEK